MAVDPIIIRFATAGMPEVSSAFARISTQAAKFEESMVASSERGGRARISVADKEAREKMKAADKVAKDAEKLERQKTRETEREAKRRGDIIRRSSEMAGRDAVRAAAEETREKERLEERYTRIRIRSSEMAGRAAAREAAEELKAREKVAISAGKYAKTWGKRISGAASMIGMSAGIGGAFALADAGRKEFADERVAAQLVNQVTTGATPPSGANVKNILAQAGAVSKSTGTDRGEIVQAGLAYAQNARRGDFAGTMGNMDFFARMAKVTGANMSELAGAAGTLQSQNADLDPKAMQQLLLNAYAQSKQGSMSLTDAAKEIGILGSTRSSFAGNVTENQRQLIGLGQIARAGGDVGESGTFVKDIALEASKADAKYFKDTKHRTGTGKHLFETDEHGRMKGPEDLVLSIFKNTGGNIQQINDLMGVRGGALFRELEGSYIQGAGKGNNVEAGIAAVRANMREVTGASMTAGDLNAQFEQTMSQPAEKFGSAMNRLEQSMQERLAPALEKFADKLSDPRTEKSLDALIDGVTGLANFLIDLGPFKGVAAVIGARVAADIAQAQVGKGVSKVLGDVLKGSISDKLLAGLNIATATLVVASLMNAVGSKDTAAVVSGAGTTAEGVASGTLDPKSSVVTTQRDALIKRQAELKKLVEHPRDANGNAPLFGDAVAKTMAKPFTMLGLDTFENQLDTVTKALQKLEAASKNATGAVQGIPPVTSGAPGQPIGSSARH